MKCQGIHGTSVDIVGVCVEFQGIYGTGAGDVESGFSFRVYIYRTGI